MLDKEIIQQTAISQRGRVYISSDSLKCITYILKDENSNTCKIGKTQHLRNRISAIRGNHHYNKLDYVLIAFTPGDIERLVQNTIIMAGGKPKREWAGVGVKPIEMFDIEAEDVDCIITSFSFQRVNDGAIPKIKISPDGENRGYLHNYDVLSWGSPVRQKRQYTQKPTGDTPEELYAKRKWSKFLRAIPIGTTIWPVKNWGDFYTLRSTASMLHGDRSFSILVDKSDYKSFSICVEIKSH